MPIDKNQMAAEMYTRCKCRACTKDSPDARGVSEFPFMSIAWVEDIVDFDGWRSPDDPAVKLATRGGGCADYEVDAGHRLIRLGDQIDEELYPARGLWFIKLCCSRRWRAWGGDYSVKAVTAFEEFSRWADTPRNRELGLAKPERSGQERSGQERSKAEGNEVDAGADAPLKEKPMTEKPEGKPSALAVGDQVRVTGRDEMFIAAMKDYEGLPGSVRNAGDYHGEIAVDVQFVDGECWKYRPSSLSLVSAVPESTRGQDTPREGFVAFTAEDFAAAVRGRRVDNIAISKRQFDRAIYPMRKGAFCEALGFHVWVAGDDDEIRVYGLDPTRSFGHSMNLLCTWQRGHQVERVMQQLRKQRPTTAEEQQQMVDTQSRSLMARQTVAMECVLPDGRIAKSPPPDRAAWDLIAVHEWPGEFEARLLPTENDMMVRPSAVVEGEMYPVVMFDHREGMAFEHDIRPIAEREAVFVRRLEIFRRNGFTRVPVPRPVDCGVARWRARCHERYRSDIWPEGGHPSRVIQGSSPVPGSKRTGALELLNAPEKPREFDGSCWPGGE